MSWHPQTIPRMKKILYILFALPFMVQAQTYQTNGKNVYFYTGGGTTTGSPGGTIMVDGKVLSDSLVSKDSTVFISAKDGNFLYFGENYPFIPGGFYGPFHGISGDTTVPMRYINGQINFGDGDGNQIWTGLFSPAEPEDGNNLLVVKEKTVSLRVGDTLYNKRHGLTIRRFDVDLSEGLPGFALSYYDTARYESGFSGYPSYPGGYPHADHYVFDTEIEHDISLFQTEPDRAFMATMYDTVARDWNTVMTNDSVGIYVGVSDFRNPDASSLAVSVNTSKQAVFYGTVSGNSDFSTTDPTNKNMLAQRAYVDGQLIVSDYGTTVTPSSTQRNISVAISGAGTGASTVNISGLPVGALIRVSDLDNKATANAITIDAGAGNTINTGGSGISQTIMLNTDGLSYTLQRLTATKWMLITSNQ